MEYVDGVPITNFCDDNQLTVPERLRLFGLVCEAVQYAHQNLVVHRDIKPGNILTTKERIPKLLDFGIAKMFGPEGAATATLTQREQRMLTPDYASPEQVRGLPVSTASDIYSPLSGEVVEANRAVVDNPALANTDPYGQGWFFKIKASNAAEAGNLLSADSYKAQIGG